VNRGEGPVEIKNEEIEERLRHEARDSRINCTRARKIAEELGVSYRAVGDAANRLRIKIHSCELGCF